MKNISTSKLIVGSLIAGLGVGLYHYLSSSKQKNTQSVLNEQDREQLSKLLEILEEERQQMFNVCFQMADLSNKYIQDLEVQSQKVKEIDLDSEIAKFNNHLQNEFDKIIKSKVELILVKYSESVESYNHMLSKFKDNPEIKRLTDYIAQIVLDSLDRKHPSLELKDQKKIDQNISDQQIIEIYIKILINANQQFQQIFKQMKKQGEKTLSLANKKIVKEVGKLKLNRFKIDLLKQYKIDGYIDSPNEILSKKIMKIKRDPSMTEVKKRILELEECHEFVLDIIEIDPDQTDDFVHKVFENKIDRQAFYTKYNIPTKLK